MTLSNFVINNLYPNNSAFINFPTGYDSNLSYSIISSDISIVTISNDNVINALSVGTTTITFSQGGDSISTTLTVDAVPVLVQANDQTMIYGGTIPDLTYNINHQITDIKKSCNKQNIGIIIARQKIGYGINLHNGSKISDLTGINLSRFDAGNSTNPYINIWVTNSDYTNYAVISISPNWSKEYKNASYDTLKNEDIFIYETIGVQLATTGNYPNLTLGYQGTSWIANVSGVSGDTAQLKLSHLANLEIKAPPSSWFSGSNGTGSGAPRELSTYNAYGFNWMFGNINNNGDGTLADYIIGNATCNNSSSFTSYIIRNANDTTPPNIITDLVYNQSNISIGANPILTLANSNADVGNYIISFDSSKFNSPYNLTFNNATLTISKATINVSADHKSRVYGSNNPTFTYSYTGFLNSDNSTVISGTPTGSTSATVTSNVGTYNINPDVSGLVSTNYTFTSSSGTLTITKAIITVNADNKSRVYNSSNPAFTFSFNGFLNSDNSTVISGTPAGSTSATVISNAGTYNINTDVSGLVSNNYTFNGVNGTLTIYKAIITVTVDNKSRDYGARNPTFTFSYVGFQNGDTSSIITGTPIGSTSATVTSNAGTYNIIANISGLYSTNYDFDSFNGTLTITKAVINVSADNKSRDYGYDNPSFTYSYSGFLNSDTSSVITGTPIGSTSATVTSNVGTYTIIPNIIALTSTNYNFSASDGTLTITKATITVTAENKSRVYGYNNPNFTFIYSGFQNSDNSGVIGGTPTGTSNASLTSNIGNYNIIPNVSGLSATNYTFRAVNGILTVNKAVINVIADNKSRVYGSNNPSFTYSYSGFLNSDTSSVINGNPSPSTSAIVTSNVGTYNINLDISDLISTNYNFNALVGTLTVNKAVINVIADNKSKNYGDSNPTFTYTITGFLNNDTSSVIYGLPTITTTATQSSSVNGPNSDKTYYINVSNGTLNSNNYDFNPIRGKLTINPITPIVCWKQDYIPPMIYNCILTDNQLSALSTDKISGISNGNFTYNVVSSNNVQTTVSLGGTIPTTGNYTLYATLNVTNPNYLSSPIITISKPLKVVTSNLTVKWYNPVSISHNNVLTTEQLNAVCNDPNAVITYVPPLGSTLSNGNQNLSVTFHTTNPGFTYDEIKNKVNINIT
jgi:hypothetical protein